MDLLLRVRLDLLRRDFPARSCSVPVVVPLQGIAINANFRNDRTDIRRWLVRIVDFPGRFPSFLHRRDRGSFPLFRCIVRSGFVALRGLQANGPAEKRQSDGYAGSARDPRFVPDVSSAHISIFLQDL
jgi:hypothetical protein